MKRLVSLAVIVLLPLLVRAEKIALVGGTTINPGDGRVIRDAVVLLDRAKIDSLGAGAEIKIPPDARRIDCTGKFLIPGLWDMHVHVAGGTADPKWARASLLPLLLANGVTGIRDMGGDLDALQSWRKERNAGALVSPRIIAAGPFLADARPGTPDTISVKTPEDAHHAVQQVRQRGADFVKILSTPSRESYFAIGEEAKAQGLAFVGHVPDSISAIEASNAGQKSIEHIFYSNLAFDCSANESSLRRQRAQAAEKHDQAVAAKIRSAAEASFDPQKANALWQTFIRNKTWIVPTLVAIQTIAHQRELAAQPNDSRLAFVPPALRAKWTPAAIDRDLSPEVENWYREQADYDREIARAMHAAGVLMMAGSDSLDPFNFPGASLHQELKLFVEAGFSPMAALQSATVNPARFLDRDGSDGFGALAPGRLADIVILDANPLDDIANTEKIRAVIIDGRLFDRPALDRLLEQARAAVAHN